MKKSQLNIYQISGLTIVLLGEFIQHYFENNSSYILTLFGLLIFLLGSKLNLGIVFSIILYFAGNISIIMYGYPLQNYFRIAGVLGILGFGYYQFIHQQKERNIQFMFLSIVVFLIASLQLNWYMGVILFITGLTMLLLAYTYRFFKKPEKNFEDYLKLAIAFNIISLYLFSILRLPGDNILLYLLYILLSVWLVLSLIKILKNK